MDQITFHLYFPRNLTKIKISARVVKLSLELKLQKMIFICLTILNILILCLGGNIEFDVSWDFNKNNQYEGWAKSTAEEMKIETRVENGELLGTVEGCNPFIDSPLMLIDTQNRHYVVFRMSYYVNQLLVNFYYDTVQKSMLKNTSPKNKQIGILH